jgi:hypothetical protein
MSDLVVLVSRPYTKVDPLKFTLKTDSAFDGTGLLTRSKNNIDFTVQGAATPLKFDGTDNKFPGANLTAGIDLLAVANAPSTSVNDVVLTLTLSGGSKKILPPATTKLTAVQATLDICDPRINDASAPAPLPTANAVPAAGAATDKFYLGRPLPTQTDPKIDERATLIVRELKPTGFKKDVELTLENDQIQIFEKEKPDPKDPSDKPMTMPLKVSQAKLVGTGFKLFVEGAGVSPGARGTGISLTVDGVAGEADHVKVTVCHTEIVSNRKPGDLKIVAQVPEKPERKTNSAYIVAPIIVGLEYPVEMRPYIETAKPSAYHWSTVSPKVTLKDVDKEVVGLTAKTLSGVLNDVPLEVLLTTDIGKLKKKHLLTCVKVIIDPVSTGDKLKTTDPINAIKNPAGCVILAAGADAKEVPRYEITKITPDLTWTDDDDRIAWWILGGDAKGDNKYDGKADFMNTEAAKRGTKIQVFGVNAGDVLIRPYSGGYGYGMYRANVVPISKIKFRINRIFTRAQAAQALKPAFAALPAQAAQPAFPGGGGVAPQPAVPDLAAVDARPVIPAVAARVAHQPTASHASAKLHMQVVNIYLRQAGIEMVPDDSAEVASPALVARPALPAVAAQPAVVAQVATPDVPGVPAQPAVPGRPAVPVMPAVPEVKASAVNPKVGQPTLDAKVIAVTQVSPGFFDVEVDDPNMTFVAGDDDEKAAIRINTRNEVISFAFIHSEAGGAGVLATAKLCPWNHAPVARTDPPRAYAEASYKLSDLGTPSSSLKPKDGIPPDVPADVAKMLVLKADVAWQGASPGTRHIDLLWGVIVPTSNIDSSSSVVAGNADSLVLAYANTLAHELGHIFGLGHRGGGGVPDGLTVPGKKNLMHPTEPPPAAENLDVVQVKAIQFSEALFRSP